MVKIPFVLFVLISYVTLNKVKCFCDERKDSGVDESYNILYIYIYFTANILTTPRGKYLRNLEWLITNQWLFTLINLRCDA